MNLKIGIDYIKPGWEIVLKQIGVSFSKFSLLKPILLNEFSVIIITETHNSEETKIIEKFLDSGGAVLYADNSEIDGFSYKMKRVNSLYASQGTPFSQIGIVDIYSKIKIFQSKETRSVDQGLEITSLKRGINIILPFNVNDLILNTNSRRKKFYTSRKELPSEIVSTVSKGKLRKIVELSLEYLHHKRDLPFVHLWHQPFIDKNVFIFRLDTDFCSIEDADEMYKICRKNNISATWFLDTESDERIRNYTSMKDQEMALHCDKHYVYNSIGENYKNIQRADEKLKKCGIKAAGFAAPFGAWNTSLDIALQKMKLRYSSEFTLDYDDLPFYPFCNTEFSNVLQIPIHPISLGRLHRSHLSEDEMLQYYLDILEEKKLSGEPIIIYHHPHHKYLNIFDKIFQHVNSKNFCNMSMKEFSEWWRERSKLNPEFNYKDNKININYDSQNVFVKISTKDGYTISKKREIKIDEISFKQHSKVKVKKDLRRTRKFHWRDMLYNYESGRSKKTFK
ncbi:MAG: hypothetical protein P9L97_01215 [Candidatus Tenebribacter davisii]|nr:hypothetical protein [Candidatus Tenebribacter davisii]